MNKYLASSVNPNNVSLTIKGATVLLLVYLVRQIGYDINQSDALMFVEAIALIGGAIATVIGLARKVMNN